MSDKEARERLAAAIDEAIAAVESLLGEREPAYEYLVSELRYQIEVRRLTQVPGL